MVRPTGAWLGSRRLVSVDGVHLDATDTAENVEEFGRFSNRPKTAATSDERSLAATLFDACEPGVLLTADRKYPGL